MSDWYGDVLAFHRKFGCYTGTIPATPPADTVILRMKLMQEEWDELRHAIILSDLPGVADAAADLIYVVIGLCIAYGIDLRPVWDEVQRTNMAKEGGPTRADGKICKPDAWQPPDIAGLLAKQTAIG